MEKTSKLGLPSASGRFSLVIPDSRTLTPETVEKKNNPNLK
jgi:hypothetical protein